MTERRVDESDMTAPRLVEALPDFAVEIEAALREQQRLDLAAQVDGLRIVERCSCEDDFCATFYTAPKPGPGGAREQHSLEVEGVPGFVTLDLLGDEIRCVEVLYRPDVRSQLRSVMP